MAVRRLDAKVRQDVVLQQQPVPAPGVRAELRRRAPPGVRPLPERASTQSGVYPLAALDVSPVDLEEPLRVHPPGKGARSGTSMDVSVSGPPSGLPEGPIRETPPSLLD